MNCDGSLDLVDVEPFSTALLDPDQCVDRYPDCDIELADLNRDGSVNLVNIEPFMEALLGG